MTSSETFWDGIASSPEPEPLNEEALLRFIENVKSMPPDPCRLGKHVVSSFEYDRGYGVCANCMRPVGDWPA